MAYNQNYGTQYMQNYAPGADNQPQPLNQSYGYQSDEYMRQPAAAPYPTAPAPIYPELPMQMQQVVPPPQPQIHQPQPEQHFHHHQEPRVIIVQQPVRQEDDCCCDCFKMICGCIDWLLTRICYAIVGLLIIFLIIGLVVYFTKFYKNHH